MCKKCNFRQKIEQRNMISVKGSWEKWINCQRITVKNTNFDDRLLEKNNMIFKNRKKKPTNFTKGSQEKHFI